MPSDRSSLLITLIIAVQNWKKPALPGSCCGRGIYSQPKPGFRFAANPRRFWFRLYDILIMEGFEFCWERLPDIPRPKCYSILYNRKRMRLNELHIQVNASLKDLSIH